MVAGRNLKILVRTRAKVITIASVDFEWQPITD